MGIKPIWIKKGEIVVELFINHYRLGEEERKDVVCYWPPRSNKPYWYIKFKDGSILRATGAVHIRTNRKGEKRGLKST